VRNLLLACILLGACELHAAYPLVTEDTGTQGAGRWQLEGLTELEKYRDTGKRVPLNTFVIDRGMTDNLDLQVAVPWYREGEDGLGDVELYVKWRYFERGNFSLGFKPSLTLPTGDDRAGRGTGKATWGGTLMATYVRGPLEFNVDLRAVRNNNNLGERETLTHAGAGIQYDLRRVRLVADMTRETAPDPSASGPAYYYVMGVIWPIQRDFGVGAGYKKAGGGAALEDSWLVGAAVRW
jgi:hypothetical protein